MLQKGFGTDPGEHLLTSHYEAKFRLLHLTPNIPLYLNGIINEVYFDITYTVHLWIIKIFQVDILTAYLHRTQLSKPGHLSLCGTHLCVSLVRDAAPVAALPPS
jgi:hypothetical protein